MTNHFYRSLLVICSALLILSTNPSYGASTIKKHAPAVTENSCKQWDNYLTSTFGKQNDFFTGVASLFCATYSLPSDLANQLATCTDITDGVSYLRCVSRVTRTFYGFRENMCKQISCAVQAMAQKREWVCKQIAFGGIGGGHVITRCQNPDGTIVDSDPQSGNGNFIIRTENTCDNSWDADCTEKPGSPGCPPVNPPVQTPKPQCYFEPYCGGCGFATYNTRPTIMPEGYLTRAQCDACNSDDETRKWAAAVCVKAGCDNLRSISKCAAGPDPVTAATPIRATQPVQ